MMEFEIVNTCTLNFRCNGKVQSGHSVINGVNFKILSNLDITC